MSKPGFAATILPVDRLTPYLRVRISTDNRSLVIDHRHAPLGFIPLWTHRIRVPLAALAEADVRKKTIRLQCLVAAVALAASAFVLDLALAWRILVGIVALLELPLALGPGKAVHVERTDGRTWTIPFCRTHELTPRWRWRTRGGAGMRSRPISENGSVFASAIGYRGRPAATDPADRSDTDPHVPPRKDWLMPDRSSRRRPDQPFRRPPAHA